MKSAHALYALRSGHETSGTRVVFKLFKNSPDSVSASGLRSCLSSDTRSSQWIAGSVRGVLWLETPGRGRAVCLDRMGQRAERGKYWGAGGLGEIYVFLPILHKKSEKIGENQMFY